MVLRIGGVLERGKIRRVIQPCSLAFKGDNMPAQFIQSLTHLRTIFMSLVPAVALPDSKVSGAKRAEPHPTLHLGGLNHTRRLHARQYHR